MAEKPKALHVLGLEIAGQEIRGAKLSQSKGKPILDNLFSIALPPQDQDVKPLYIKSGKSLNDVARRYLIATALPQSDVLVRSLELSLKKAGDIDAVLAFQAEPIIPYPIENAILDRIILSQKPEGSQLTLLSARKDHIQAFLDVWRQYEVEPEVVTCAPAALAAFSALVADKKTPLFVLHLARTQTICVLVREGHLIASQNCTKNLGSLEQAFALDTAFESEELRTSAFNQIAWEKLSGQEMPHLKETLDLLKQELTRTLFSLTRQLKGEEVPEILITGDCGSYYDLMFHLGYALNKQLITPDVPSSFNAPLPQVLKFAGPIGVALGSLPMTVDSVNFRQADLAYPDPWKRLKRPLSVYFGLCLALALALYVFGEAYLGYKEDEVREEYTSLLSAAQIPHAEMEKNLGNAQSQALASLAMPEIQKRVQNLEKELAKSPNTFPLLPNIMTVSDVLAWISSQPTVATKDPQTGQITGLIQIDNFSYTMVKRPEINKKNERYQVKVELEFTTPTPKEAREFHDALIAPNALVDPKGEVKWSTNRGKYRASFYLKDKTAYPAN